MSNQDIYICDKNIHFIYKTDNCPDKLELKPHIHELYEIYCFLSGEGEYVIEGSHYPLTPGSILIMRPTEFHHFYPTSSAPYSRFILEFSRNLISSFDPTEQLLVPFHNRPVGQNNLYLPKQFSKQLPIDQLFYATEAAPDPSLSMLKVLSCLFNILTNISLAFYSQSSSQKQLTVAEQIVNYIDENLSGDLTIKELSKRFFLTKWQIERAFQKHTQLNIKEYITSKRLHLAKELLNNGEQATQVFSRCGFNDYSAFYRAYKQMFGSSPKSHININNSNFQ